MAFLEDFASRIQIPYFVTTTDINESAHDVAPCQYDVDEVRTMVEQETQKVLAGHHGKTPEQCIADFELWCQ